MVLTSNLCFIATVSGCIHYDRRKQSDVEVAAGMHSAPIAIPLIFVHSGLLQRQNIPDSTTNSPAAAQQNFLRLRRAGQFTMPLAFGAGACLLHLVQFGCPLAQAGSLWFLGHVQHVHAPPPPTAATARNAAGPPLGVTPAAGRSSEDGDHVP